MALLIKTTGIEEYLDASGEAHIKALILGEPSAGKTRSASFWPKPIFADCENGRMSLADRRVPYAAIKKSADMMALLKALDIECKTKRPADRDYQTLVIDTLDAYQRIVIQEILTAGRKEAMAGWADWGQLDAKMTALVAALQALPMNVIVNNHVKATKDGDDGPLVKEPKLKGDLRDQIAAEFDLVGYMSTFWEAEKGERVLKRAIKWHPEPGFPILKDRSGQLPRFTEVNFTEADYLGLFEAMFAGSHFESLAASEDVEVLPEADEAVVAPMDGGPVPVKKAAAKKTAATEAKPVAEPKPKAMRRNIPPATTTLAEPSVGEDRATPAQPPEQEVKAPVTGVSQPPAALPDAETPEAMEETIAVVADTLGGQVVSADGDAEDPTEPEAPAVDVLLCGTAAAGYDSPAAGCGRDLGDVDKDLVNIALIKTKTYLCPDCLSIWRASHKK